MCLVFPSKGLTRRLLATSDASLGKEQPLDLLLSLAVTRDSSSRLAPAVCPTHG